LRQTKRYWVSTWLLVMPLACGHLFAEGQDCSAPADALPSTNWSTIRPAHLPVETFFSTKIGWSGLNHVSSKEVRVKARYRALLPGVVPSLVQVYPFDHALARVSNSLPVFYVNASDMGSLDPNYNPGLIHMVRMTVTGKTRIFEVTRGITAFNFEPSYPKSAEVPIEAQQLSASVISLRPLHPLPTGEYLITLGGMGNDGFEFGIDCR
jgi:hypothetical protein